MRAAHPFVALVGVLLLSISIASAAGATGEGPSAAFALRRLSSDPFTNKGSQHHTEVEPDSFAFRSTIVTAFQMGRFDTGGSSDIGWARSVNAGKGWTSGILPSLTRFYAGGAYDRASDPSVAYDVRHKTWIISSLGVVYPAGARNPKRMDVVTSRSVDNGGHWKAPVVVASGMSLDKNWTACDNRPSSPHYGNCYTEYDDPANHFAMGVGTSTDGGQTWTTVRVSTPVLGGQPLVQPNGTLIIPARNNAAAVGKIIAFRSRDGGATFGPPVVIATLHDHHVAGNLRSGESLPSAEIDESGKVYVAWADCLRAQCSANDIVISTSTNGTKWTTPKRVPLDAPTSSVDHFIPGLAVDPTTRGSTARLALTYYFYPVANCTASTCRLDVGFVRSNNGGATWSKRVQLAGPMKLSWLPATTLGRMVGDYISTSFVNHVPKPVFAVAGAKNTNGTFNEAIYTTR